MDNEYLTKDQIEIRILKLNSWIESNPTNPMQGTAKKESMFYAFLLKDLKECKMKRVKNTVPTQIFQQIGKLL